MLIGFIGSPSCGKSTTAFGLCHELKKRGYAVEFFAEHARRQIMETRIKGGIGNGGMDGQHIIYNQDCDNAAFYRDNADAISITDGSSVNCYFYGLDTLDLTAEMAKYDVLFYVSMTDVPPDNSDANRVQNNTEILHMAERWDHVIRPYLGKVANLVEIRGYPSQTTEAMLDQAISVVRDYLVTTQNRKAA